MRLTDYIDFKPSKLPLFLQSEVAECGITCIAMIAYYHGYKVNMLAMRQRYPAYDNFFDHSNVGHPRGWSIVTSDDGDIWQFAQRDLKDTWTGELRVQLAEPIVNAKYIGIIVHSVSGARGISPTWCAFNGLDFQCM